MEQRVAIPYGKGHVPFAIPAQELIGVYRSGIDAYEPGGTERQLIAEALAHPIGTPRLREMAKGKKRITLITSDHTRPVPSKLTLPALLAEIREGNPEAEITLLVATGCHRSLTEQEKLEKFGLETVRHERLVIHDCDDEAMLADIGTLPSGGRCRINRLAVEADLLAAEGFIEPHFFAGFSGGRKSVLPGIASRETVLANHCAQFIAGDRARTGILDGNPIHADMIWAARRAGLQFIFNVVLNHDKRIIHAVAGSLDQAYQQGCDFLNAQCRVSGPETDLVITSNGGYPLDQNIYQAVKGLTAAVELVRRDGVIIMLSQAVDGHGGENFYRMLKGADDIKTLNAQILQRGRDETQPDQWQVQILLRVLQKARVIFVSDAPDDMVRSMHMIPAHSAEEAMAKARSILGSRMTVSAIPDGVSVVCSLKN